MTQPKLDRSTLKLPLAMSGGRSAYLKADADGYFRFYTADQRPIATFGQ